MVRTVNRASSAVATAGLLVVIGGISVAADGTGSEDPWIALKTLRSNLEAQPLLAEFVQEYLPAGFTSGDRESGVIYLDLPGCVRWDYLEPYAKSFLLCGAEIYTWNPGEGAGRRFEFTDNEEPGNDLQRLRHEELEQLYGARSETDTTGTQGIVPDFAIAHINLPGQTHGRTMRYQLHAQIASEQAVKYRGVCAGYGITGMVFHHPDTVHDDQEQGSLAPGKIFEWLEIQFHINDRCPVFQPWRGVPARDD